MAGLLGNKVAGVGRKIAQPAISANQAAKYKTPSLAKQMGNRMRRKSTGGAGG